MPKGWIVPGRIIVVILSAPNKTLLARLRSPRELVLGLSLAWMACVFITTVHAETPPAVEKKTNAAEAKDIKSYCIDFNWQPTGRRGRPFAKPGQWSGADPAAHVAWYKAIGANVIQTFCVATNGYAWYKNGFVPEQPGLKHDFLPEVVKLGHKEGMKVMGYFCISSNPRWGAEHPDLSYGTPTTYHIPYTDEYLDFLSKSISDAVSKTGIDGFMIDWLWMPKRESTQGKWLDCEKKLYQQLMGEAFPGEDKLSKEKDTAYSRKAIDRCWKTIRKAAKDANPDCVVWLTVNQINNPHVLNSDMYKEADWLMNEAGSLDAIRKIEGMVGKHTHLITCMALWNGQDASKAVPEALQAGVGLYGFTAPRNNDGLIPLESIFSRQVSELSGDDKNIAVLARAYHGMSSYALWKNGTFVEPTNPPPYRLSLQGRGRGVQDTATITHDEKDSSLLITTPYGKGRGQLFLAGKSWPTSLIIRLQKTPTELPASMVLRMANSEYGFKAALDGSSQAACGQVKKGLNLDQALAEDFFTPDKEKAPTVVKKTASFIEIVVPPEITKGNSPVITFEWN